VKSEKEVFYFQATALGNGIKIIRLVLISECVEASGLRGIFEERLFLLSPDSWGPEELAKIPRSLYMWSGWQFSQVSLTFLLHSS
jgi:hypothetical protein